jgi:hypothetical protein
MAIKGLKLVTGEDVISDVENSGDNRYKLTNSVQLRMVPPQVAGGQPSMGFVPFPPFASKGPLLLEPLHVAYMYEPIEEIVDNYKQTFSGIITPPKQIITG